MYDVTVSEGLISDVTSSIEADVRAWQSRPLEELYVVVYLDALQVAIRDQQVVRKKAVYVAIGVTLEGTCDYLGLWLEKTEGARLWTSVLTEIAQPWREGRALRLHRRPHRLPRSDRRGLPASRQPDLHRPPRPPVAALPVLPGAQELRERAQTQCSAADADAARDILDELTAAWADSKTRTAALQVWERAWERVIPFLAFPTRCAASSTPGTESIACTCRSARRSRPAGTSRMTRPHSD
jgi:putative transposase